MLAVVGGKFEMNYPPLLIRFEFRQFIQNSFSIVFTVHWTLHNVVFLGGYRSRGDFWVKGLTYRLSYIRVLKATDAFYQIVVKLKKRRF